MPGRNRRMGGEDAGLSHRLRRFLKTLAGGHPLSDSLQHLEGGMPLVAMPDVRTDAEGAQQTNPADPENDFLTNSKLLISAVEPGGEFSIPGGIFRNIRIH